MFCIVLFCLCVCVFKHYFETKRNEKHTGRINNETHTSNFCCQNIVAISMFCVFFVWTKTCQPLQRNVRQPGPAVAPDICFFVKLASLGCHSPLVWNEFLRNSAYLLSFLFSLQKSAKRDNDKAVHCGKTINKTKKQTKLQFLNRNFIICTRKKHVSN